MWQQGGNSQLAEVPRRMLQGRFGPMNTYFRNHYGTFPTKVEAAERWKVSTIWMYSILFNYFRQTLGFVVCLIQFERASLNSRFLETAFWVCSCIAASETALFCWGNYLRFVPHTP